MKCQGCGFERKYSILIPTMFCPRCGGFLARPKNFTPQAKEPEQAIIRNELRHYNTSKPIDIFIR
jgi:hypothetical protein